MKPATTKASRSGKRTHTLKEILERQEKTAKDLTTKSEVSGETREEISLPNLFDIE